MDFLLNIWDSDEKETLQLPVFIGISGLQPSVLLTDSPFFWFVFSSCLVESGWPAGTNLPGNVQVLKQKLPYPKNLLSPRRTRILGTGGIVWNSEFLVLLGQQSCVFRNVYSQSNFFLFLSNLILLSILLGKHQPGVDKPDPKTWKANFRCAMNSLPDIEEVKDKSIKKGNNAFRVYRMLPLSERPSKKGR